MHEMVPLSCLAAVVVAASIGCMVGVERLVYWSRFDRRFIGGVAVTFAWVLPEYLIALNAVNAPGLSPRSPGEPFIVVGAVMGSAAANMLIVGLLSLLPRGAKDGLEGRELASAASLLLVTVLAVVGTVVNASLERFGRGQGMSMGRLVAGCVVFGVLFACRGLVDRSSPIDKPVEPDSLFHQGRGSLVGALLLAGASIVALAYAALPFVALASPLFRFSDDVPRPMMILLLGGTTIVLGVFLAVPDLIVSLREPNAGGAPRLLNTSAALVASTVFLGTPLHPFASSLYGSFTLTVFVVSLTLILLLALPGRLPGRLRGLVLLGVASAGFAFALLMTGR